MGWDFDPRRLADEVSKQHRLLCIRIALNVDQRLVLATPVDTGRARSNWLASLDEPRREIVAPRSEAEAAAETLAIIEQAKEFPIITLSNNLPYIRQLNEGSSKQAPAAFIQTAMAQALSPFEGKGKGDLSGISLKLRGG